MTPEEKCTELRYIIEGVGKRACDYFDSADSQNALKPDGSVVTEVDQAIERALHHFVRTNFPDDTIIGEEQGVHIGQSTFAWHIDPIDGTDNFLRRVPFFAISVARLGETPAELFAVVHNPITKQTFFTFGETEGGVYENERLCRITPEPLGGKYVISIGRSTKEKWMKPANYALNKALGTKYGRCTSYNCTALELAYLATNRIDGYLTYGLQSYDYAAGLCLAKAAGGAISVFENGAWRAWDRSLKELCAHHGKIFFVSHPDIHDDIVNTIGDLPSWATK